MNDLKILFLGNAKSPVFKWLIDNGENVMCSEGAINKNFVLHHKFNFLISYGYRHLLKKNILNLFKESSINLHISYLPFNKGADPNFWSFVENSPKGVTIHKIDEGLDTGEIIVQKKVFFKNVNQQTLSTTYGILQNEIQSLFYENWYSIKNKKIKSAPQIGSGSIHRINDIKKYNFLLEKEGWNTKIKDILNLNNEG